MLVNANTGELLAEPPPIGCIYEHQRKKALTEIGKNKMEMKLKQEQGTIVICCFDQMKKKKQKKKKLLLHDAPYGCCVGNGWTAKKHK